MSPILEHPKDRTDSLTAPQRFVSLPAHMRSGDLSLASLQGARENANSLGKDWCGRHSSQEGEAVVELLSLLLL